jgi:hypothetical protein
VHGMPISVMQSASSESGYGRRLVSPLRALRAAVSRTIMKASSGSGCLRPPGACDERAMLMRPLKSIIYVRTAVAMDLSLILWQ